MKKMPWVKWYPADFLNGVQFVLCAEAIGVYAVILNMIYDNGGPIVDNIEMLARRLMMRPTSLEKRLIELVEHKKIIRVDGVISNSRAEIEIDARVKNSTKSRPKVDEISVKSREKVQKNGNNINGHHHTELELESELELDKKKSIKKNAAKPRPPGTKMEATRIDPHRKISDQNIVFAKWRRLTKREIDHEWMLFVRYYGQRPDKQPNAKSLDWDSVWESWVLRAADRLGRDSFVGEANGSDHSTPETFTHDRWIQIISTWKLTNNWSPDHGPAPGRPGCKVPSDLVTTN